MPGEAMLQLIARLFAPTIGPIYSPEAALCEPALVGARLLQCLEAGTKKKKVVPYVRD